MSESMFAIISQRPAPGTTLAAQGQAQPGRGRVNSASSAPDKITPSMTEAMSERLSQSNQALQTMTTSVDAMRRSRKSAAKERLRQLIEQVKLLRQLGGDPKQVARQAARLAKDIAAATKEYGAGAGEGGDGATGAATTVAGAPSTDASPAETTNATAAAATFGTAAAATVSTATTVATAPSSAAAAGEAAQAAAQADHGDRSPNQAPAAAHDDASADKNQAGQENGKPAQTGAAAEQTNSDQAKAAREQLLAAGAAAGALAAERNEDSKLLDGVRNALSNLRGMIRHSAREAEHKRDRHGVHEAGEQLKQLESASREVARVSENMAQESQARMVNAPAGMVNLVI